MKFISSIVLLAASTLAGRFDQTLSSDHEVEDVELRLKHASLYEPLLDNDYLGAIDGFTRQKSKGHTKLFAALAKP